MVVMLPSDNHVHSQWSWDAPGTASMHRSCARAAEIGLPSIAFTEHVDFSAWGPGDRPPKSGAAFGYGPTPAFDVAGYLACVDQCRQRYRSLRILTGLEAGEPHLFAGNLATVLRSSSFDRVLGSLHAVIDHGRLVDVGAVMANLRPGDPARQHASDVIRRYFAELLLLVDGSDVFEVLAHVDYPRRNWRAAAGEYDERDFEPEYRAVFRALAGSGRVLEINTCSPLPSAKLVRWWHDEKGGAVSFGSDAHQPSLVAARFAQAAGIAEAAGFKPGPDPLGLWRR